MDNKIFCDGGDTYKIIKQTPVGTTLFGRIIHCILLINYKINKYW